MSQITETNAQYYQGAQGFRGDAGNTAGQSFTTTFDTGLVFYNYDPANENYALNNFKLYTSVTGLPGTFSEYSSAFTVVNNIITNTGNPGAIAFIIVQLKRLDGGQYGTTAAEKAYGETVEDNYGGYEYIKLNDIIDNLSLIHI